MHKGAKLTEFSSPSTTYFRADFENFTREGKKEADKMFTVISIDMYEARVLSRKKTMKVKTFSFDGNWQNYNNYGENLYC